MTKTQKLQLQAVKTALDKAILTNEIWAGGLAPENKKIVSSLNKLLTNVNNVIGGLISEPPKVKDPLKEAIRRAK